MRKYSPVVRGITLLLLLAGSVGCNLIEDSYRPKNILGYPSPSESSIQWGGHTAKVTANIISVDVECIPLNKGKADTRIIGGKTGTEYEIAATAHIRYKIFDKGFFKKATAFSDLEANLIFEPVTASGCRRAVVRGKVTFIENTDLTTTTVRISGFSTEEINSVVGVQARWE